MTKGNIIAAIIAAIIGGILGGAVAYGMVYAPMKANYERNGCVWLECKGKAE